MTSIFQAGQPFNVVRTSSTTYQANDKDLVISSGDEVALPSPNQGATILVRPAPSIDSVKITTSNGTIGNTGETFGIYRATEPIYLVGDGTDWYARSGSDEISAIPDSENLQARYVASSLSLADGDSVSTWTDQADGFDLSASGSPTYRSDQVNGSPAVSTDGSDDELVNSSGVATDSYTVAGVLRWDNPADFSAAFADRDSGGGWSVDHNSGDWQMTHGGVENIGTGLAIDNSNAQIFLARYDAPNSSLDFRVNQTNGLTDYSVGFNQGDQLVVGQTGTGTFADAFHVEYLYYDVFEDDNTMTDIETYLDEEHGPIL